MPGDNSAVREALKKKAAYGADVDIERFEEGTYEPDQVEDLEGSEYEKYMEHVGVVADEMARAGTLTFIDNGQSHCSPKLQEGLELMSFRPSCFLSASLVDMSSSPSWSLGEQ